MAKSKKKANKLSFLSKFNNPKSLVLVVFVLGFGAFGIYKLAFSSAYVPGGSSSYSCAASTNMPSRFPYGGTIDGRATYYNKGSTYWNANNTNPIMSSLDGSKYVSATPPYPNQSYSTAPGKSVSIGFKLGTAGLQRGRSYTVRFTMNNATSNNTTTLMSGTSCQKTITIY